MYSNKLVLFASLAAITTAKLSSESCFTYSLGPLGSDSGRNFTDIAQVNSDVMTVDMRVSSTVVCTDPDSKALSGLQLTLTDTKTKYSTSLSPVGNLSAS